MRTFRQYRNFSQKAKAIAWGIDLLLGPLFKVFQALYRAGKGVFARRGGDEPPCKFLLIRLDHIGDLLMTFPAIHALKQRFPGSSLSMLASPSCRPIIAANPEIDTAYSFRVSWYDGGRAQGFSLGAYVRLICQLRRKRFDAVIDFRGDFRVMGLFLFPSGARQRVGFSGLGGEFLLTRSCLYDQGRHFVEMNLALVDRLSGETPQVGRTWIMPRSIAGAACVDRMLAGLGLSASDRIVGIHPGTIPHWHLKRWAPERFAALADSLVRQAGAKIVFTGGAEDVPELKRIAAAMKESSWILGGKTSLLQLAELIRRCRLFITNDTGPMHVAAAVQTPLVAIFGPTDPRRSGPWGDPSLIRVMHRDVPCRRPCFVRACPIQHECMSGISLASVLQACHELLGFRPGEVNP